MKIVFIFPFKNKRLGNPLKWLPLGVSTLIGNIEKYFPQVVFHQIDLEEEVREALRKNKLNKDYFKIIDYLFDIKEDILTDKDLIKFDNFFSDLVKYLKLNSYDHYFFSVVERFKIGLNANILLAKYLKNKYKDKKIIFGGHLGIGDKHNKHRFNLSFVDAYVIGTGETSTREIIEDLLNNKKIKKIYQRSVPYAFRFSNPPNYKTFKNIQYFQYSCKDLEKLYCTNLPKDKINEKVLFVPYKFSEGCFWSKCAYCVQSTRRKEQLKLFTKDINQIVNDLLELKENYNTKFFIFFNNNFNSNLEFSKKLLRAIIKNKLNILWTDSFNLRVIDDELLDLLVQAGCFRVDVGCTILDPKLQKLYHNISQNKDLKQLRKISQKGIWIQINLITNMPHQYTIREDKKILEKYMQYIDAVALYNYVRKIHSDLGKNYEKYNLKIINQTSNTRAKEFEGKMYYMENDFNGSIEERKKIFIKNYLELKNLFIKHNKPQLRDVHLYLLGYLYNNLGFGNKDKIKKIISEAKFQNIY